MCPVFLPFRCAVALQVQWERGSRVKARVSAVAQYILISDNGAHDVISCPGRIFTTGFVISAESARTQYGISQEGPPISVGVS